MRRMSEFERADQSNWNRLAPLHARSVFYDVAGFKAGRCTLMPTEREELGDVAGKSLLHLQCHFGMDTLSWARLGARVTGVDYAENAIELARELSRETGLKAAFVCASIYDLPERMSGQFDIVFTSYGVLCWLPDLPAWGQVIAHFLRPGGICSFYEYILVRKAARLMSGRSAGRRRVGEVGRVVREYIDNYAYRQQVVLLNFPPAMVHHIRFPEG